MGLKSEPTIGPDQQIARGGGVTNEHLFHYEPRPVRRRGLASRYTHWLHTRWPAGTVEPLPAVRADGSTNVPGVYVVGDLTGIPLLKFAADSGAKAVRRIAARREAETRRTRDEALDLVIVGGGVSGFAAALEAQTLGLRYELVESAEPFSTIVNFPARKPIFTYPTHMTPAGELTFSADIKEDLVAELHAQTLERGIRPRQGRVERILRRKGLLHVELAAEAPEPACLTARSVIIAIGRSGDHRMLNVPGEDSGKVYNRLHDPNDFAGQDVLVVGGGDSALETAIAIAETGGRVTLSYRRETFSRPKPENVERMEMLRADPMAPVQIEEPSSERESTAVGGYMDAFRRPGAIQVLMPSQVKEIRPRDVVLSDADGRERVLPNDAVFTMLGREAPLALFRRSGVAIRGQWSWTSILSLVLVLALCVFIYHWKKGGVMIAPIPGIEQVQGIGDYWSSAKLWPYNMPDWWVSLGPAFDDPKNLLGTLRVTVGEPGFYYSLCYCLAVALFGIARIRRRRTPYVTLQTVTLALVQIIPLFLLPYILLPWMGYNGWFNDGSFLAPVADALFPKANYGHGREYWRAFGFILAWPLFIWNVFTDEPLWTWLAISVVQTFGLIPLMIYFWGKGAYCGWICSCGALAETMGDAHRNKMPHGPLWNRLNMLGQVFLAFAFVLLVLRVIAWTWPGSWAGQAFQYLFHDMPVVNYVWFVDLLWAGILGVGLYWHFSGRVWCRFACPLAALMHIYTRFSRFRILAEKKKCISCNVCTSVCHQGIDVMNFANKGLPMDDPECVRCSACVQSCPTGVLYFGQVDRGTGRQITTDPAWLGASPVRMVEMTVNGKKVTV